MTLIVKRPVGAKFTIKRPTGAKLIIKAQGV